MTESTDKTQEIIDRHALYAAGAGLVPLPIVDLAAIMGFQLKMLKDLAEHYEIPFKQDRGKAIVSALLGGGVSTKVGYGLVSLVKAVPVVGPLLAIATTPAMAAATTKALGKVFVQHFESGGTFLNFDPEKVREFYQKEVEKPASNA